MESTDNPGNPVPHEEYLRRVREIEASASASASVQDVKVFHVRTRDEMEQS